MSESRAVADDGSSEYERKVLAISCTKGVDKPPRLGEMGKQAYRRVIRLTVCVAGLIRIRQFVEGSPPTYTEWAVCWVGFHAGVWGGGLVRGPMRWNHGDRCLRGDETKDACEWMVGSAWRRGMESKTPKRPLLRHAWKGSL